MLFFIIGAAAAVTFIGWLTFTEFKKERPSDWKGWLGVATLAVAQICVWAVIIKAAVS